LAPPRDSSAETVRRRFFNVAIVRVRHQTAGVRDFDPSLHVLQLRLAPTSRYVRIVTDHDRVAAYVRSAYGDVVHQGSMPEDRTDEGVVLTATIPATVRFNAVPLPRDAPAAAKNPWASGAYVVDQIVWRALAADPDWIPIYACAVEIGGRAVILVGAGGVGKTTLGLALADRGAGFYGDEMVLINRRSRRVSAVSRRLILRAGTLELLGNPAFRPSQLGPAPPPAPLGAVMMLERGSGAPRLSQLSATRAAVVMRPYLGTAVADFNAFASLVQIISLNRCFRLVAGDPVATAAAIAEVMSA
jgi:hypothetical protein